MPEIKKLKADLDKAVKAEESLLEERRSKRDSLSKSAFREYNEETRQKQIDVTQARVAAENAITEHLNNARQEIFVGTVSETETANG